MNETLKILLLEHLPEDAELVESELRKGKIIAKTLVVDNRSDFINALEEFSPDIVLSDHSLPDFNSIEALKIIKASGKDIPFILTTSTVSEEFAVQILQEGADDYILKSNLTRLSSSIIEVIKKHNTKNADEKAIQELHAFEKLALYVENSSLGYLEWNISGLTIRSMSKRAEEIFGFMENEFKTESRTAYSLVHESDLPFVRELTQQLIEGKVKNGTSQQRNYTKDGSVIWCEWFNCVSKNKDGEVIGIMSLVQDITDRKIHDEELQKSEERYRRIVETSQEGIWTIDEFGNTNFVNRTICRILEFTQEEMMGKKLYDFMDKDSMLITREILESQKLKPKEHYEFRFITKSGAAIWANISINAIFGVNQEYLGVLAMVSDITERKHSEIETLRLVTKLQSKNRDLKQFSYMVSHNLRAPIAKIQGLAYLFDNTPEDLSFNRTLLENITTEAINLDNVVKDMNSIIAVHDAVNQNKEYVLFETDLNLIKNVLENEIKESGAEITFDFIDVLGVLTVKSYLYSIIYNLLSNAIKFRRENVPLIIHMHTYPAGEFICFSVKDNGEGINLDKYSDKIFGLYKKFHGVEIPGRGIGLSLVKTQAESLGGRAEVESTVNVGSTFRIFLPK